MRTQAGPICPLPETRSPRSVLRRAARRPAASRRAAGSRGPSPPRSWVACFWSGISRQTCGSRREKARLSRLAEVGLEHDVRSAVSHPDAPEGAVLAQSPIPGQQVRPGAPVEVTLSRGPEVHSIPDVSGLSARQASIVLDRLGFRVTSREANHSIEAGRAFGTEPGPGTELTVPADVTLLVSKGSPLTTVPDLSGRHIDDALELLSESGLGLGAISYDPLSLDAPGRIVGQYPPGGYGLRRGDPVEVRVAGRPEEVNRSRPDRPVDQDSDQPEEL